MKQNSTKESNKFFKTISPYLPLVLRAILVAFVIWGVVDTFSMSEAGYMSINPLYYYTIQSNIVVGIWALVLLATDIALLVTKKQLALPQWIYTVKFSITVAITVTMLVFWCLLAPQLWGQMGGFSLTSISNLMCHTLVPLFALLDWFVFSRQHKSRKKEFLWGLAMPLYYLVFSMAMSTKAGIDYGYGSKVPYFFLDYEANGWFNMGDGKLGVVWWIIIVLALVVGLSMLIMWGNNKINQRLSTDKPAVQEVEEVAEDNKDQLSADK